MPGTAGGTVRLSARAVSQPAAMTSACWAWAPAGGGGRVQHRGWVCGAMRGGGSLPATGAQQAWLCWGVLLCRVCVACMPFGSPSRALGPRQGQIAAGRMEGDARTRQRVSEKREQHTKASSWCSVARSQPRPVLGQCGRAA